MFNSSYSSVFLFVLLILLVGSSCTKPPDYPNEPVISFVGMDKNTMTQGALNNDQLYMTISFTDGDGDLGSSDNSMGTRVFYTDTRKANPEAKSTVIPMVPELGTGNGIEGEITFRIFNSCCIYPGAPVVNCEPLEGFPTDTIIYEVYIEDRAGNKSNVIQADPVVLLCN